MKKNHKKFIFVHVHENYEYLVQMQFCLPRAIKRSTKNHRKTEEIEIIMLSLARTINREILYILIARRDKVKISYKNVRNSSA